MGLEPMNICLEGRGNSHYAKRAYGIYYTDVLPDLIDNIY